MDSILEQLRKKSRGYWIGTALAAVLGILFGHWLGERNIWLASRYMVYRWMQDTRSRAPFDQHTFVITIGDDEYWKGTFQRRSPIRRDLLAALLERVAQARPKVIALDFDLRSPMPDGSTIESPAYIDETNQLIRSIRQACKDHRTIVLPATIARRDDGEYIRRSDIYSQALSPDARFLTGYIALPPDTRAVQLQIRLAEGQMLDSFALAAARAYDGRSFNRVKKLTIFPFGGYMAPEEFLQMSASKALAMDPAALEDQIGGKLVFIGGNWHRWAWNEGGLADGHLTPVGWIPGVFVHANYAEAILDNDVFTIREWVGYGLEAVILAVVAVILALEMKLWIRIGLLAGAAIGFIVAGYVLLQNLGIYFDFFVPVIFLLGHVGIHKVLEWRSLALEHAVPVR